MSAIFSKDLISLKSSKSCSLKFFFISLISSLSSSDYDELDSLALTLFTLIFAFSLDSFYFVSFVAFVVFLVDVDLAFFFSGSVSVFLGALPFSSRSIRSLNDYLKAFYTYFMSFSCFLMEILILLSGISKFSI